MTTTPPTVTLATYGGRLRYRYLPITIPTGWQATAMTVASLHTDPGAGELAGRLIWAHSDEETLLMPLTLAAGQVVAFSAGAGVDQVTWVGVTTEVTDNQITLAEHATLEEAWQAALAVGDIKPVVPITDRAELIRWRSSTRVLLLDLTAEQAKRVLTGLIDGTDAMPPALATAVLNRVHNLARIEQTGGQS